ncbi:hypothetical protein EDB92DRAFT_1874781 [Lactarius akahatsu]|uniref:Uncharacterized protein n=1 Tax=Lactarius akahatsu TaxID=416441 RepID=A0AAD4Q6C2_9AGAM|nr:hypothetical protein EDB92DRAFT_1874781 [Lactarius akahatsu]
MTKVWQCKPAHLIKNICTPAQPLAGLISPSTGTRPSLLRIVIGAVKNCRDGEYRVLHSHHCPTSPPILNLRSHPPPSPHSPPATTAGDGRVPSLSLRLASRSGRQGLPHGTRPILLPRLALRRPRHRQQYHHRWQPSSPDPRYRVCGVHGSGSAPVVDPARRRDRARSTGSRVRPAGQAQSRAVPEVDECAWAWCVFSPLFFECANSFWSELTPLPRPPDIDVRLANGAHLASVPTPYPRLSSTPSITSPIGTPRGPPRNLTIDVGASRAIQDTSRPSAGPQTPTRSLHEVAVPSPGPTSFPRREPHSAATQRVTFEGLTSNEPP